MNILLIIVVSACNMAFFLMGAKVVQKVQKDEPIEVPTVNPVAVFREYRAEKEAEREKGRLETILGNIDRYDGTGAYQEEVR